MANATARTISNVCDAFPKIKIKIRRIAIKNDKIETTSLFTLVTLSISGIFFSGVKDNTFLNFWQVWFFPKLMVKR